VLHALVEEDSNTWFDRLHPVQQVSLRDLPNLRSDDEDASYSCTPRR
jgi:hypothetical protein